MFKFLLEGKIGEILAPVTGISNQLFLAIQHHRNDEVNHIVISNSSDWNSTADSGYSALHVSCRYNNRFAVDLLLSRGASINVCDTSGNTALHYASKYGHLELVRLLVEKGCSPAARNNAKQTPYDVTESHMIRQYLLPLQLQCERETQPDTFGYPSHGQMFGGYAAPAPAYAPSGHDMAPPPPVSIHGGPAFSLAAPPASTSSPSTPTLTPSPLSNVAPPPIFAPAPLNLGRSVSAPAEIPDTAGASSSEPLSQGSPPILAAGAPTAAGPGPGPAGSWTARPAPPSRAASASGRMIQPDGFHSSASDPNLQAKYGHIKETVNIAPPPTGPMGMSTATAPAQYSMFSGASSSQPVQYNRYVPYEMYPTPPHGAASSTAASSSSSSYGGLPTTLPSYGGPPAPQLQQQQQQQPPRMSPAFGGPPPSLHHHHAGISAPVVQSGLPPPAPGSSSSTTSSSSSSAPTVPPSPPGSVGGPLVGSNFSNTRSPRTPVVVNVFNPATDCDVITADSNSRSVL